MVENMKNMKTGAYVRNGEVYDFNFGTDLSIADKARFVNSVVSLVVSDENYNSIIRDLIFDYYTIKFFTDINTAELEESPNFLDDVELFLSETNIVDIVRANVEVGLFDELNDAVNKSIEYRTGIHPSPLNNALANLINTLEKKIVDFDMTSAMDMAQKFVGVGSEITPESIVSAYINSDAFKNNLKNGSEGEMPKSKSKKGK